MKSIDYSFVAYYDGQGDEKENNCIHRNNLFVIIDGVGRDYLGKKASNLARNAILESFFKNLEKINSPSDAVAYALQEANRIILEERLRINEKMAASVCIIFIQDKIMYFSHLGDSRIYIFQDNELNQLTRDHTLREEDPFAEKRYDDPRALQALIKGLGIHETPDIYIKKYPLEKKGILILTTERLTERVSNRDIQWLTRKIKNPKKICKSILELFGRKGGDENFTLGIIRYGVIPKWVRKILSIYVISFLIIIAGIGGYFIMYSDHTAPERQESGTKPVVIEDLTTGKSAGIKPKELKQQSERKSVIRQPIVAEKAETPLTEKPSSQEKETSYDISTRVSHFLSEWKTAWEMSAGNKGNIKPYLSFYSNDFRAGRLGKKGWAADKSRKNKRKKWIRVDISDIKISKPDSNNQVTVSFSQNYRSSNFSVVSDKVLLLKKENNKWLIISERSN